MQDRPNYTPHSAHWGACLLCHRVTWISAEQDYCTQNQPDGSPGCKFAIRESLREAILKMSQRG